VRESIDCRDGQIVLLLGHRPVRFEDEGEVMASVHEAKAIEHLKAAEILLAAAYEEPVAGKTSNRDVRDAHIGIAQVYATLSTIPTD
jgi:hypothetical protein